jgi:CheY-like chemotaxis protein
MAASPTYELGRIRKRILVADDSPTMRAAVANWFAGMSDFEPLLLASNGAEAIEQAISNQPDLAILDLAMPVMDGLEAARRLNALRQKLPIIIFTLHWETMKMKQELLKAWGISGVVRKDEATTTLLEKVRELLHLDSRPIGSGKPSF